MKLKHNKKIIKEKTNPSFENQLESKRKAIEDNIKKMGYNSIDVTYRNPEVTRIVKKRLGY